MTQPQFNSYACPGDFIEWDADGFTLRATLHNDHDTRPTDYDCYDEKTIAAWRNDDWLFVGVVLSVYRAGVLLDDHAASLWGVDCNFPESDNSYLAECAREMQAEALASGADKVTALIASL
jgi:hypothetical protein